VPTIFRGTWSNHLDPNGTQVVWRALTWIEFKKISEEYGHIPLTQISPADLYQAVYAKILIAGPAPETVTAGIASNVALQQLQGNAFSSDIDSVKRKLNGKRAWIQNNYLEACRAVIAATFHTSFETMDQWDEDTLFERFAQAEYATGVQWNPASPRVKARKKGPAPQAPQEPQRELTGTFSSALNAAGTWSRGCGSVQRRQRQHRPGFPALTR